MPQQIMLMMVVSICDKFPIVAEIRRIRKTSLSFHMTLRIIRLLAFAAKTEMDSIEYNLVWD